MGMILWGDLGIAKWAGGTIVPALDDVYVLTPDGAASSVTGGRESRYDDGIRALYRSYATTSGYQPGIAAVYRGHLFLPIIDSSNALVDMLVCRLDLGAAWTRWAGHAASVGYAVQAATATVRPKLLGVSGLRVTDLTGCLDATSATSQDADSTTPTFRVDENDIDTGAGIRPNTTEKVRYVYETTGGTPTISVSYATGPEGSCDPAASLSRGGGSSTGVDYSAWKVAKKAERIRFRFECTSQVTSLILRRREATIREQAQN
jgi:hypothetical protein